MGISIIVSKDVVMVDIAGLKIKQVEPHANRLLIKLLDNNLTNEEFYQLQHHLESIAKRISHVLTHTYNVVIDEPHKYARTGEIAMSDGKMVLRLGNTQLLVAGSNLSECIGKKVSVADVVHQMEQLYNLTLDD